ncbi:MAG: UDP-N-acetylglucosamine 2-epimerase [Candidatus Omnitrophota bacterium]
MQMLHIAIGTKAQFIKMSPVIKRLEESGIAFNLIDLGQHAMITRELRKEFGLKSPSVSVCPGRNVSSIFQGLVWMARIFWMSLSPRWIKETVFMNRRGICLIHGDTVSTIMALYLAKRAGLKTAHIEAGLRSFDLLEPFPEEILRLIVMRHSDILFAPSKWALSNLDKMGLSARAVPLAANTSLETTVQSLNRNTPADVGAEKYCLVTVHRMENIFSAKRLALLADFMGDISRSLRVVFIQHPPTVRRLEKSGLCKRIKDNPNIRLFSIISHSHFIGLVAGAEFVITDGGSIQEECFYLDKPCLLLRNRTERMEGIGENVSVSQFKKENMRRFYADYKSYRRKSAIDMLAKPSEEIIDYLARSG